jgi:hypothetical protein
LQTVLAWRLKSEGDRQQRQEGVATMPKRGRPRLISNLPNTTKLFVDDRREVLALSAHEQKSMSDAIRELVHEALRERRLRACGRDEQDDFVRRIHRETIAEGLHPLTAEIAALRQIVETVSAKSVWEERPSAVLPSSTEQALLALVRIVLSRAFVTENLAKILVAVGMQRDNLKTEEIQALLASQEQHGHSQAEAVAQKILDPLSLPTLKAAEGGNGGSAR